VKERVAREVVTRVQIPRTASAPQEIRLGASAHRGVWWRLRNARWAGRRIDWAAYLFILPFLIPFCITVLGAIVFGVYVSFTDWPIFGAPNWVGTSNYAQALHDPWLAGALSNTLRYALMYVPGTLLVALSMALYVNGRRRGYVLARAAFYLPNVISVTVVGVVWVWILATQQGLLNNVLGFFGIAPIGWLTNPDWVLVGVALTSVWWDAGFIMVLLLAGLQDIPKELREAASIDGCGSAQTLWHVTLPLLRPSLSLSLTLLTIYGLRVFSQIFVMTNGGPADASTSVIVYVYEKGFTANPQLGYASAISMMLFVTILIVTAIQLRVFREMAY
jgi:multiple sugar transport system permease protein